MSLIVVKVRTRHRFFTKAGGGCGSPDLQEPLDRSPRLGALWCNRAMHPQSRSWSPTCTRAGRTSPRLHQKLVF